MATDWADGNDEDDAQVGNMDSTDGGNAGNADLVEELADEMMELQKVAMKTKAKADTTATEDDGDVFEKANQLAREVSGQAIISMKPENENILFKPFGVNTTTHHDQVRRTDVVLGMKDRASVIALTDSLKDVSVERNPIILYQSPDGFWHDFGKSSVHGMAGGFANAQVFFQSTFVAPQVFGPQWPGFSAGEKLDMGILWDGVLKEAYVDSMKHQTKSHEFLNKYKKFGDTYFSAGGLYYLDPASAKFCYITGDYGHVAVKHTSSGEVDWRHSYINYYGQSGFNAYIRPAGKPEVRPPAVGFAYFDLLLAWQARSGIDATGLNEYAGFRPSPSQDQLGLHTGFYKKLGFTGVELSLLGSMFGTSKVSGNLNLHDIGGDQQLFEKGFTEPCKKHINRTLGLSAGCWCAKVKDEVEAENRGDLLHDGKRTKGLRYKECPKSYAAAINLLGAKYSEACMKRLQKKQCFEPKFDKTSNLHDNFRKTLHKTIFTVAQQVMLDPRTIYFVRYGYPQKSQVSVYGLEGSAKNLSEHKFSG